MNREAPVKKQVVVSPQMKKMYGDRIDFWDAVRRKQQQLNAEYQAHLISSTLEQDSEERLKAVNHLKGNLGYEWLKNLLAGRSYYGKIFKNGLSKLTLSDEEQAQLFKAAVYEELLEELLKLEKGEVT